MSEPKSPPAFPMGDPVNGGYDGMPLRDWLAGHAIGAVIRQCANDGMLGLPDSVQTIEGLFARNAYSIADAMLAERERT